VAHNLALRFHQREAVFDELRGDFEPADRLPDPEHAAMERQRQNVLQRAIRDLSPRQRNCLHLRAQGLRYREIAAVIGISTSAATEFLRRAAVRLKGIMDGY
jgi:RNA polymerase sigma-70 factor (ECF subfamily)